MKTIITIISALIALSSCKSSSFLNQRYTHFKHNNSTEAATKDALTEKPAAKKNYLNETTKELPAEVVSIINTDEIQIATETAQEKKTKTITSKAQETKIIQAAQTQTIKQNETIDTRTKINQEKAKDVLSVIGTILITLGVIALIIVLLTLGFAALIIFAPFA